MAALAGRWSTAALVALSAVACSPQASPAARLLESQGTVEREHARRTAAAPTGEPFVVGDAARTGSEAWARLRLRGGAVVRMGADTRLRFLPAGARLERGDATAEDAAVTIITEAGPAIIERGGVLRATDRSGATRFEVVVGRAVIQRDDGAVTLEPGAGLVVAVGGAIIERIAVPAPPPPSAGPVAPPPLATTIGGQVNGRGVIARVDGGAARTLPPGDHALAPGTVVTVPRGAGLALTRGDDRATITGPAQTTIGELTGPLATSASGRTRVEAGAAEVAIAVPGGVIITRAGAAATLDVGRTESRVRVERGDALLDGSVSDATARAGETGLLDRAGAASIRDRTPTTVEVEVEVGERAVIHDPSREVAVRVSYGDACPGATTATLELADGKGSFADPRRIGGPGGAAFYARAGTSRFRVRCPDGTVARAGSLRVAGDTGAAPVVRTAPENVLEADGRRYTVSYQNRLPQLAVGWSEAAGASVLHVVGPSGVDRTFTATGRHQLPSGALDDGRYTLWITAGARSSPRTTLTIAFDNAAPTAQITAPSPGAAWTDPLVVRGVTIDGWRVAIDGQPTGLDASGRFRAEVAVGDRQVITIRLAHPQHGVHYYLRRRR